MRSRNTIFRKEGLIIMSVEVVSESGMHLMAENIDFPRNPEKFNRFVG